MDNEIEALICALEDMAPYNEPCDGGTIRDAIAGLKRLSAELEALKAVEPVAWRRRNEDFSGGWVLSEEEPEQNPANWKQLVIEPLYTGPQIPQWRPIEQVMKLRKAESDAQILGLALKIISMRFDEFISACLDVDGKPMQSKMQSIMRARRYLPPYCVNAFKKAPQPEANLPQWRPIADAPYDTEVLVYWIAYEGTAWEQPARSVAFRGEGDQWCWDDGDDVPPDIKLLMFCEIPPAPQPKMKT